MARFNITLPDSLKEQLQAEATQSNTSSSTLIAQYIEEHYNSPTKAGYEEEVQAIQQECTTLKADYEEQLKALKQKIMDAEQQAESLIEELTEQLHQEQAQLKQTEASQLADMRKMLDGAKKLDARINELQEEVADKEESLQALGQEKLAVIERAEQEIAAKNEHIIQLERGMQELLTRAGQERSSLDDVITDLRHTIEQERASKETVRTGLQHELELTQTKLKLAEEQVAELKGQVLKETDEKQNLYKQLELVTLRLPAPKEGLFSRIVGRRKKDKEQEAGHG